MKKTLKIAALVAAAVMAMGFVSCSNDDAEDLGTLLIVKDYQEKKEAEAAAAAAAKAATANNESESNVTTDSFNLQKPSAAITALTTKGAISADITEAGASGNLNLVLSAAGTGVGTSIGSKQTTPTTPKFQYVPESTGSSGGTVDSKGLKIKYDALKIEGIKGKVKATISWYMPSKKAAGDRNLEVTVGSGTTVSTPNTNTSSADSSNWSSQKMDDYTVSFDGGDDGTTLYIGASNELNILSIKIEAQ